MCRNDDDDDETKQQKDVSEDPEDTLYGIITKRIK